jgi:hypothetical protein
MLIYQSSSGNETKKCVITCNCDSLFQEFKLFPHANWWNKDKVFILPRPINGRYAKFKHSLEKPRRKFKSLQFKLFGCKLTRKFTTKAVASMFVS